MRTGTRAVLLALLGMAGGAEADTIPWIDFGSETNRTAALEVPASVAGFDSVTRTATDYAVGLDARRFTTAGQDGDLDTREPKGVMIIFR